MTNVLCVQILAEIRKSKYSDEGVTAVTGDGEHQRMPPRAAINKEEATGQAVDECSLMAATANQTGTVQCVSSRPSNSVHTKGGSTRTNVLSQEQPSTGDTPSACGHMSTTGTSQTDCGEPEAPTTASHGSALTMNAGTTDGTTGMSAPSSEVTGSASTETHSLDTGARTMTGVTSGKDVTGTSLLAVALTKKEEERGPSVAELPTGGGGGGGERQVRPEQRGGGKERDPDCTECWLVRPDPTPQELTMYLHALAYKVWSS